MFSPISLLLKTPTVLLCYLIFLFYIESIIATTQEERGLTLKKRCAFASKIGKRILTVLIRPNCWKSLEILESTGGNIDLFTTCTWDKEENCASIKGKPIMLRLEEESDRDVACHPYYLTYMENI